MIRDFVHSTLFEPAWIFLLVLLVFATALVCHAEWRRLVRPPREDLAHLSERRNRRSTASWREL